MPTTSTTTDCAGVGNGYWLCDVAGGCTGCRKLARDIEDRDQLAEWDAERKILKCDGCHLIRTNQPVIEAQLPTVTMWCEHHGLEAIGGATAEQIRPLSEAQKAFTLAGYIVREARETFEAILKETV